jgi:Glycosyltransferase like family 2
VPSDFSLNYKPHPPSAAVALIIPSLDGQVAPLLESVHRQTLQPAEVAVVRGVRPNGRARNQGVAQTSAPLLVFVDDDATLGDECALANLIAPLLEDPSIGVTGASKLLPRGAPWFQRWAAREVPRIVHRVVDRPLETNPDPPSFYSEITTTCCAMRRAVFEQAGGFDETLVRGVDTEFFVRVRRMTIENKEQRTENKTPRTENQSESTRARTAGRIPMEDAARATQRSTPRTQNYRFVLVPHTWTYHPAPATLWALLRKQFLYGYGHAQEVRRDPARSRGRALHTPLHAAAFLLFRTAILLPNVFLPYSFAAPSWRPGFKPLKALASYASTLGYVAGWYRADQ